MCLILKAKQKPEPLALALPFMYVRSQSVVSSVDKVGFQPLVPDAIRNLGEAKNKVPPDCSGLLLPAAHDVPLSALFTVWPG